MAKTNAAYASGMRGSEKPKLGGLDSITIRPVENGFTVDVYRRSKKKNDPWQPPKTCVFPNAEEACEYVETELKVKDEA